MQRYFRFLLGLLSGFILPLSAYAWSAPGHRIVAQIAYDNLEPETKQQAIYLTALFDRNYQQRGFFQSSAVWADQIVQRDITAFSQWHYIDKYFTTENLPLPSTQQPNVVWAINESYKVLASDKPAAFEKALFLRFLVHFVADIHQPLHCTSKVSKAHPTGEQGGNLYLIAVPNVEKLHAYWDRALGLYDAYYTSEAKQKRKLIKGWAAELQQRYPKQSLQSQIHDLKPEDWAEESFRISTQFVYSLPEHTAPSKAYITQGRQIAEKQLVLAGYRLAAMLNKLLTSQQQ